MGKNDRLSHRLSVLEAEYRSLLTAALRDCAAGQWGLFGHNEHLYPRGRPAVVDELFDLAQAINRLRDQLGESSFQLHDRFAEARGVQAENALGELKRAHAWLEEFDS